MAQPYVTLDQFLRLSKRLSDVAENVKGEILFKVFPVGSIYLSLADENPSVHFGGEWRRYAQGCCLVGVDTQDDDFARAGQKTGVKEVCLTAAQNGTHTHVQSAHTHTQSAHTHIQNAHTHTQDAHTHASNIAYSNGPLLNAEYINIGLNNGQCRARYYANAAVAVNQYTAAVNLAATAVNQSTAAVNEPSGASAPHTNVQPSIPVYMWLRTA